MNQVDANVFENVSTVTQLNEDISSVDAAISGDFVINISQNATIALTSTLEAISLDDDVQLTINGNGATLNGASQAGQSFNQRGLFIYGGNVTINDLIVANTVAQGGNGGSGSAGGGGGGAGLGGGLFVANSSSVVANVTLSTVRFVNDAAVGGNGGGAVGAGIGAGGGGGMGGNGGNGNNLGGGGGGGIAGIGGNGGAQGSAGMIVNAIGGSAGACAYSISSSGEIVSSIQTAGGSFGGGGGGGDLQSGLFGGLGGGGGGIGGNIAGSGGYGGGGGGSGVAASGGFGGGGGGGLIAGSGGFGGGGGGSEAEVSSAQSGFGGGDGSGTSGLGGGGLGAGGDIFIQSGATLTIGGASQLGVGEIEGGDGFQTGSAFGSGIFIEGGSEGNPATIAIGANQTPQQTTTAAGVITDMAGSGDSSGVGGVVISGYGTVELQAANTYTGGTYITSGTLEVAAGASAGSGSIQFLSGCSELRLDALVSDDTTFANPLTDFQLTDSLDLVGLSFVGGASATLVGDDLVVSSGGVSEEFDLNGSFASAFGVFEDSSGGVLVSAGNSIFIEGGSSTNPTSVEIGSGQTEQQTTTVSGTISNSLGSSPGAGEVQIGGNGTVVLSSQNAYSGGTQILSGVLEIGVDGSAGSGAIEFGGQCGELRLDALLTNGSTFANSLSNFLRTDSLDLLGLPFVANATATVSGNTLIVSSGGVSEYFSLEGSIEANYSVFEDSSGGSLVKGMDSFSTRQKTFLVGAEDFTRTTFATPDQGVAMVSQQSSFFGTYAERLFGSGLIDNGSTGTIFDPSAGYASDITPQQNTLYVFTNLASDDTVMLDPGFGKVRVRGITGSASSNVVDVSHLFSSFAAATEAMVTHGTRTVLTDSSGDSITFLGTIASALTPQNLGFSS